MKVSIIVPVYNAQKYLSKCIESILQQTYKNIEIILIDDGSTDDSLLLCNEYKKKDIRIKVIKQKNLGVSKARNIGLEIATGLYIVFIDSDDYWDDNNLIEAAVNNLIESNADILNFGYKKYFEQSNKFENYKYDFDRTLIDFHSKQKTLNYLVKNNLITSSPCNKFIKLKFLQENNLKFLDVATAEDIDWNARILILSEKFDVLNKNAYVYRQRNVSRSKYISKEIVIQLLNNIKLCVEYSEKYKLKEKNFFDEYMSYVAYQYMTLLVVINRNDVILSKSLLNEIKNLKILLNYNLNYRVNIFKNLERYLGFYNLILFIKFQWKVKKFLSKIKY